MNEIVITQRQAYIIQFAICAFVGVGRVAAGYALLTTTSCSLDQEVAGNSIYLFIYFLNVFWFSVTCFDASLCGSLSAPVGCSAS